MSHVLNVTSVDGKVATFTVEGDHDRTCKVWEPCPQCADETPDGDSSVRHGVEHDDFDGIWCVETDRCGLTTTLAGVADTNKIAKRRGPGRWPVQITHITDDIDDEHFIWTVEDVTATNALDILERAIIDAGQDGTATLTRDDLMTVHTELLRYTV